MIYRRTFIVGGVSGVLVTKLATLSHVFGLSDDQAVSSQADKPLTILPLPQLPEPVPSAAPTVFGTPFGSSVDDQANYLVILDSKLTSGTLNNLDPGLLTDAEVSGKRVVFEEGSSPHNIYNARKDLRKLVIVADDLEIRSSISLPQTAVEIYARRVTFADGATLSTTPASNVNLPLPKPDGTPGDGVDGLAGGSLSLFTEEKVISPPGSTAALFVLQGANGQASGPGASPTKGHSMPTLTTETMPDGYVLVTHGNPNYGTCGTRPIGPNFANSIVYFKAKPDLLIRGTDQYPTDGVAGVPGGVPGDGGDGGIVVSNLANISSIVANQAGLPGAKFEDSQVRGDPGDPNPAYHIYCNIPGVPPHAEMHTANPGLPAVSPSAKHPTKAAGGCQLVDNPFAWVRARNIEAVLQYAEDLLLSRRPKKAADLFSEYADIVTKTLKANPNHQDGPTLTQLLMRLKHRQIQVSLGMDFYGQPAGWVPLLSLEVVEGIFSAELDRSANELYLSFFLGQQMEANISRASALKLLMKAAQDRLNISVSDMNDYLSNQLPNVKRQLDDVLSDQDLLGQRLMVREQELRSIAQTDASKAQASAHSIAAMRMFAAVITLVPVAQPTGAIMGALINDIANQNDLWTAFQGVNAAYSTGTDYASDLAKLLAALQGLDTTSADSFEQSLNASPAGSGPTRASIIQDSGAAICEQAAKVLSAKSSQTVPSDLATQLLQEYEASDPEYQSYLADAQQLLLRKQTVFAQIQDIQHKIAITAQDVARQVVALDASANALRNTQLAIDTRVLSAISQLGLEATRRLQYYLYLIALAFEYRMLKPYMSSLTIQYDVKQLQAAASANLPSLGGQQVTTLMAPYSDQLSALAEDIVSSYAGQALKEASSSTPVRLTGDERSQLGSGRKIQINLSSRPEFTGFSQENMRIQRVSLSLLPIPNPAPSTPEIHVVVRHLGVSLLTAGGVTYGFRHVGYDGTSMITWVSAVAVATGAITRPATSSGAVSLLLSQLKNPSNNLVMFALPALDADLEISIEPRNLTVQLSDFVLTVDYTYDQTAT